MSDISVIIYSYKGKLLKDVVYKLINNSSDPTRLHIKIIDQHPLKRNDMFENEFNCVYSHMFWDWQHGPISYKKTMLYSTTEEYTLFIADNIFVKKDWDIDLVNFVKDSKCVISGNSKLELERDGHFFIKKKRTAANSFELTQFIDRGFLFGKTSTFTEEIFFPEYLKYHGEEEVMSLELFSSGFNIFAAPSTMYTEIGKNNLEQLYVPFSLNHNYNSCIDLLKNGDSKFASVFERQRTVKDFNLFHNDIFKTLSRLPFQTNDVGYDPMDLNFNSVDARRFVAKTKAIH